MPRDAPPKVFISATSTDLDSVRQLVKKALLDSGCFPETQEHFKPDWRSVEQLLTDKITDCAAMVHIAGLRYGTEPDPEPAGPSRSYTQREYDLGCRLQQERGEACFRVYVFVCPEDFPYDPAADAESAEKQAAQRAHRAALLADPRRYEQPASPQALKERILALREPLLALQLQQAVVQAAVQRAHGTLRLVLALVALLVVGGLLGYYHVTTDVAAIGQGLALDAPRIKAHLREASERALATDITAADKAPGAESREQQRNAAKAAHDKRLLRIDDVVASFAALIGQSETAPILREMSRILQEDGVDQALVYAERKRPEILNSVGITQAVYQEKIRNQLQPLLQAARLHATRGDSDAARQGFNELLALQPDWPDLLQAFGQFLYDQSFQTLNRGSLLAAQKDADLCLELARHWQKSALDDPRALGLLAAANSMSGDILALSSENMAADRALKHYQTGLAYAEARHSVDTADRDAARGLSVSLSKLATFFVARGQSGDASQALIYYQRGLKITEHLFALDPTSALAARDMSLSLSRLGDLHAMRGHPGDTAQALTYYKRDLEISERLLEANPDDAQAARDVSVSLDRLGDILAIGTQPDDATQAVRHFQRSLEIRERLLVASPDSAQAARDVSISLTQLGDFLLTRNHSGDAAQALAYYQRSLEVRERLLAANPDSALFARDTSLNLLSLGSFLAARGKPSDIQQAVAHYQRGLEISERLLAANPGNAHVARDISVSLERLGDLLAARDEPGDAQLVLEYYQRSVKIRESLLVANPDGMGVARDLSAGLNRLATVLAARGLPGDAAQALTFYQRSLEIGQRLLDAAPDSAWAADDVAISLIALGDALAARGQANDAHRALEHYRRSLEIRERSLAATPESAQAANNVLGSLDRLTKLHERTQGGAELALALQNRALELARSLRQRNPDSAYYGRTLLVALVRAARYARTIGDEALVRQHRAECLATLDALVRSNVKLDAQMLELHAKLKAAKSSP